MAVISVDNDTKPGGPSPSKCVVVVLLELETLPSNHQVFSSPLPCSINNYILYYSEFIIVNVL